MALTIALLAALIATFGITLWFYLKMEQTQSLRTQSAPEYDRAPVERAKHVDSFHILPLTTANRTHFTEIWRYELARFVDDPRAAVQQADILVQEVMQSRGYPIGNFEQNAANLSVHHPLVVENYRIAHSIALREREGAHATEDLRKAMLSYRILFEELLLETVRT
jgi:hypothetical protein